MIILATTRNVNPRSSQSIIHIERFRGVIRVDDVMFDLAGVFDTAREAQASADAMLIVIRREVRRTISSQRAETGIDNQLKHFRG